MSVRQPVRAAVNRRSPDAPCCPMAFDAAKHLDCACFSTALWPATALFVKGIIPLFGGFFLILGQYVAMMHAIRVVTINRAPK